MDRDSDVHWDTQKNAMRQFQGLRKKRILCDLDTVVQRHIAKLMEILNQNKVNPQASTTLYI